jgi:hypothetical protein
MFHFRETESHCPPNQMERSPLFKLKNLRFGVFPFRSMCELLDETAFYPWLSFTIPGNREAIRYNSYS